MPTISTDYLNPSQAYGLNKNTSSSHEAKKGSTLTTEEKDSSEKNTSSSTSLKKSDWLQQAVSITIAGMGLGPTDKVSFSTIIAYRDQAQAEFDKKVKEGLKAAGVAEDAKFQLVPNESGGIKVISDHPDKAKIEKYFEDNPKLVEDFQKIQALSNIEAARKEQQLDVNLLRQRIQLESMASWYLGTGNSTSSIMSFSGGAPASLFNGINKVI